MRAVTPLTIAAGNVYNALVGHDEINASKRENARTVTKRTKEALPNENDVVLSSGRVMCASRVSVRPVVRPITGVL